MKRIMITSTIADIATNYKNIVLNHGYYGAKHTLVNPLQKLKKLKEYFSRNKVQEYAGKDTANNDIYRPLTDIDKYADYIQLIIDKYETDLLIIKPSNLNNLISQFNGILSPIQLKVKVKVNKQKVKQFHELLVTAMMYEEIRRWIYPPFARKLEIKTCVFCNSNFAITDEEGVAYYTLDHWKPKSKFPFLSISFFNLMPCCFTCNRNKGDDDSHEYFGLYEDRVDKSLDVFHFKINTAPYLINHKKENLHIEFCASHTCYEKMCKDMEEKLHISSIYKEHIDVAEETIWRKYIYNESNITALNDSIHELQMTEQEVQRFIMGSYVNPEEIHKRPLTQLIQDIMNAEE